MKVRVIKPFVDRVTGGYRPTGAEFEVSPRRARELLLGAAGAYIEPVEDPKPEPRKRAKKEA